MGGKSWTPPKQDAKPAGASDTPAPPPAQNLRMVPLSDEDADPEIGRGKPSSATEFFTIPKRQVESDEEFVELRRNDPVAKASQPAPGPAPGANPHGGAPMAPPPGAAPHGMAPGMPVPMGVPMGISGPVAGGALPPGYGGAGMASLPPDPSQDLERAQSYRVFAVVAGLMMMVMCAVIVAMGVLAYGVYLMDQEETAATNPDILRPPPVAPQAPIDTGVKEPEPPRTPAPSTAPRPTPKSAPRPAPTPKPPPPPAPVASGTVTVKIPTGAGISRIDVKCENSTERWRQSFVNGTASIPNVPGPGSDKCWGTLKGPGAPMKIVVAGGNSYDCMIDGTVARCK